MKQEMKTMYKFYSYSRIALISLIVIITIIATVYCYQIESTANEEPVTEQIKVTEVEETTKVKETTEPEDVVVDTRSEYERLTDELNNALETKDFDYEVNALFKDTFERVYDNFESWEKGYRDFPTREEFIMNCIINPIYIIEEVEFYEAGSEEAERLLDDGMPLGWTWPGENPTIGIIAEKADTDEWYTRENDIERFLHELTHCKDGALLDDFNSEYDDLYSSFSEGMATFTQKFMYGAEEEHGGSWGIADSEEEYNIEYSKYNCIGYLIDLNFCEKLVYLAGYKNVEKVEFGEIRFADLVDIIASRYGREETDKFFDTVTKMYVSYEKSWRSDEVFNLAVEAEMMFLDFMKQDIERLNNAQAAKAYKPIYDFYINKNLPVVEYRNSYANINREFFEIEALDELLNEKLAMNSPN